MAAARTFKELDVWQNSIGLAMDIYAISKRFPPDERFSMTDQVRRSSRSVAANISEAWRERRYPASFVSKMNDAEAEAAETQTGIELARRCLFIDDATAASLDRQYEVVLAQLSTMIRDADAWCAPFSAARRTPPTPPPHHPTTPPRR